MHVSEMAAIHLLRSQTPLLNSSKFKLLRHTLNSLIIYTQHDQNPNFSRQLHSITPKSSPESPLIEVNDASQEPFYESSPGGWSTFSNPPFKPTNSIKSVGSNGEEGSRNPSSPNDVNGASDELFYESSPSGWSTFSTVPFKPTNSVKSVGSNGEEGSRNPSSPNDVNGASDEPFYESSPSGWSTFSTVPSKPTNSVKSVGSNGEEGSTNPVNLSSNMAERKVSWVCSACEETTAQWWKTCKSCNSFGTLNKISVSENETSKNMTKSSLLPVEMVGRNVPVRLMDVNRGINHTEWRIRLAGLLGSEVNTVLGGGVVPGSLILVGGDPGVGKSTLALQMAALIAVSCDVGGAGPVLYISGEESVEQIGNRADRLGINTEDLFLYSSADVKDILEKVRPLSPRAVVIDSIQTVYLDKVIGSAGGLSQVKECTSALLRFAKKTNIPILLVGHVNKSGEIAGPRVLEHTVDVVLYMEGERHSSHRLLRTVKNRFGSTDELGVFKMSESGLEAVSNPSEMFLSEEHCSEYIAGHAITVIIDGSRSFLVEIQALCVSGTGSTRHVNGVNHGRADMILSVLKKQVGLKLDDYCIYLNILSGVYLTETSGDLAMAVAICSSFLEFSLPKQVAFIGEIGLGGELRMVPRIEKRVTTLAKLGYKKCVVPESARKALAAINSKIQIVYCKNLNEVIDEVFRRLD